MIRRNTLKKFLAIFISGVTFINIIGLKNTRIKKPKKPMNIKYKTQKEIYDEINEKWLKPSEEKKKQEELRKIEEQKKKDNQNNLSRGGIIEEKTFILTFYTSLTEENSIYGGVNCKGKRLQEGMIANNLLPLGTEIHTKEFGILTVADRGGSNFNIEERLDVFIPRENGESDYEYKKRVNSMGKVKVKGWIIK